MELVKIGDKTYYIANATNIGVYKINDKDVFLIDTGNDKDAGKKILKIINEQGWNIKGIINTHSNADHIGGNKVIQDRSDCIILANGIEKSFTEYPILESSFLYGAYPFEELQNKFLCAKESRVTLLKDNLPLGLESFNLKGHFFDMIGIKTSDDVYFLADALFSEETISKYHLFYIYNVKEFFNTLEFLKKLNGNAYVLAHCKVTNDISNLIEINKNKVLEISDCIFDLCSKELTFEEILQGVFEKYNLDMNLNQYVLVGSTIKAYLTYLHDLGKLKYEFIDNKMIFKQIK